MKPETISLDRWPNCVRLANAELELVVTTDVGPRVLVLQNPGRENVFKIFPEQLGGQHEQDWQIRGGHRFWLAPEDHVLSYHIDNGPLLRHGLEANGEYILEAVQSAPQPLRKTLGLTLAGDAPRVTARHTVVNEGENDILLSPWALSVMQPGGIAIIPQPPLGEHPRDLQPNRTSVLWPYTDLSDPRWTLGQKFWMLRQAEGYPPTKMGLAHREKWIAYVLSDSIFIKTFSHFEGATYPDGGCSFETFTNSDMLEIESLGPLISLEPGGVITHLEDWYVFPLTEEIQIESEETLSNWIAQFIAQTHLS